MTKAIPVVDVFAGPGGLGEGFGAYEDRRSRRPFRIALSIEKDPVAHATLELRAFYRQFHRTEVPKEYFQFLRGEISRAALFRSHRKAASAAANEAWKAELGATPLGDMRNRIKTSLPMGEPWVLIGGPPCQAYSLAGRSRNKGIEGYDPESDVRQTLYVEYLQILADHRPHVFVMENVKGLISATLATSRLFERIVDDLSDPPKALRREGRMVAAGARGLRYQIYPLAMNETLVSVGPESYVVYSERHGIPQTRHRVILLGVRDDLGNRPQALAQARTVASREVLCGLPRLRSGVTDDNGEEWLKTLRAANRAAWLNQTRANGGAPLVRRVLEVLDNLVAPRKGRGGEFVAYESTVDYEKTWYLDPRIGGVCNHATRTHMPSDLYRYLFASCFAQIHGRSPQLKDFPKELLPRHGNVYKALNGSRYFADRFRVQLACKPATTITSHISKDGHYYIHFDPFQCRSLTVREAARLQTFPDNYFFCGERTPQFVQVGNAVPPLLARQIAGIVHHLLD